MEMNLTVACPEGYEPDSEVFEKQRLPAKSEIIILRDPKEAAGRADVIYTDVWVSMGQEKEAEKKKKEAERLSDKQQASFLRKERCHCASLPACAQGRRDNR